MRLISAETLQLVDFSSQRQVRYAILSHRWEDEELTYDAIHNRTAHGRGLYKLRGACNEALRFGCQWLWLDTCCIDKSDPSELTEAINSMYRWYKEAHVCIVYLHDCHHRGQFPQLDHCEWFTRGWTLQELIAPSHVAFFDNAWRYIGTKAELCDTIAQITQIQVPVLKGADPLRYSIAQRFCWAAKRETTKVEDRAYCLFGLFDVSMPMLYGEGERAFQRLQEEIMKYSNDQTIFGWSSQFPAVGYSGLMAHSPACFANCDSLIQWREPEAEMIMSGSTVQGFSMTNLGLSINLRTIPYAMHVYLAILYCTSTKHRGVQYGILLRRLAENGQYRRILLDGTAVVSLDYRDFHRSKSLKNRPLLVRQLQLGQPLQQNYGFWVRRLSLPGFDGLPRAKMYSRDGDIIRHKGVSVALIPNGQCGTACVIHTRPRDSNTPWWRVEYIVLGFSHEFEPCFMLGSTRSVQKFPFIRKVVFEDDRSRPEQEFSNSWLSSDRGSGIRRDEFRSSGCYISKFRGGRVRECTVDFLNVRLFCELVYTPRGLDGLHQTPYTVWAIDVESLEGPSPQIMADRDAMKKGANSLTKTVSRDLPRGIRQVMLGTLGIEALGLDALGLDALADLV